MGVRFDNFTLHERLGMGGSAEVWRATTDDQRDVAIKLFREVVVEFDQLRAGEAARLARVDHRHILKYVGSGELPRDVVGFDVGTTYIVTELIEGPTLRKVRPRDWTWVQHVTLQLLDALAAAHARNIVHLDLKPTNVLLRNVDPADVVLADFGIAHRFEYDPGAGGERPFIGTPGYMAPEQIQRYVADFGPWTDIYSLGAIVFELCTGLPPFTGEQREVLKGHLHKPPPTLESTRFAVPERLDDWLARCLVKDTAERFARAADAAWALIQVCRGFDAPDDVPVAIEPDERVVPDSSTITWVESDLRTLGGPAPPSSAPDLVAFPTAAPPARWTTSHDAFIHNDAAEAIWAEVHQAFRENEARGVVLSGDRRRRDATITALITRVFEFGVGTHVLLREDDPRDAADRTVLQLFRVDHFKDAEAAATHCEKLIAAVGATQLDPHDALALRDWVIELVDGGSTTPVDERVRLIVEFLRHVPRTPLVVIEGLTADREMFANSLVDAVAYGGTGAVVIVSIDEADQALQDDERWRSLRI